MSLIGIVTHTHLCIECPSGERGLFRFLSLSNTLYSPELGSFRDKFAIMYDV